MMMISISSDWLPWYMGGGGIYVLFVFTIFFKEGII
jgi:hypothetical protein